jgi:hypothetical protein
VAEVGTPYHRSVSGTLNVSYGYCFAATTANEQLDVAGAEAHLRHGSADRVVAVRTPDIRRKARGIAVGRASV